MTETPSPTPTPRSILGERIRARRKALDLSQEKLADRCGLHWSYIGHVERGRCNLSLGNLLKIANGLEVDVAELVRDIDPD